MKEKLSTEKYASFTGAKAVVDDNDIVQVVPSIRLFNTLAGSALAMYVMLLAAVVMLAKGSRKFYVINFAVMLFLFLWFLLKGSYTFVVEKGFSLIYNHQVPPNYLLLFGGMAIIVISLIIGIKDGKEKILS
jgi:hypothetical protein